MRTMLKHWVVFSAPLLITLGVIMYVCGGEPDVAVFFKQHAAAHPNLKTTLKIITDWSNPIFYVFYGVMLIQAFRSKNYETKRYVFILLAVQAIVAAACVHFLKQTIGRPRPTTSGLFQPITTRGAYHSLPSGHTTEIIGWTLPLVLRKHRMVLTAILGLFVAVLGFSRIYLSWHHPTDVFFAWMLGSLGGFATQIIADTNLFRQKTQA